jgi:hypothetical protein
MTPRTETERPNPGAFLVRDGVVVAGTDPILSFLEIQTATGEPVFGLLRMLRVFDLRRTSELPDGRYEFDAGITRRVLDVGKAADCFADCECP